LYHMPKHLVWTGTSKDPIPEQPVLQAFVDGYLSFD
jgi:hypothetical protein